MNEPREREDEIFAEALGLPAGERSDFLNDACRGDSAMRQRIEELLQANDSAGEFMTSAAVDAPKDSDSPSAPLLGSEETPGNRIGNYKLLQKLGEGGCGAVWLAEQKEPVRRRVALKIIKLGMDTREVVARFEAERQALALMDHPNIAKVLDAGSTQTGRPFFVMELVHGIRITDFCDKHNLAMTQRLELFDQVCHAVQHAHQKGIIHRDLKPSNILVTLHDGVAVPKVIDFGIAKATQGRLTDRTLFTAFEQFIGTPAYMSPEQAEVSGIDIDTRSDVYSLGVLLYELSLTGLPPFDPKSLVKAGLDEIRRIIREVEPPRPSLRLTTLTDVDRATIAKYRGIAPARHPLLLRGDLDWIVMHCLEKDRTRRYSTANGLAADILRYLNNMPVTARPPKNYYLISKFVRRNRLAFVAVAAVLVALVSGFVTSTWQAVRATRAERRANVERARAEDLLTFMLGDLRKQLAKVGRLDVLESVGDKAMAYFTSQPQSDVNDATLLRHATALTQIGEIRMAQARYADAAAAFTEAYERAAALAARHPENGEMLFARGEAESWVGYMHRKRDEYVAAREWLTRYYETCQQLVALDPSRKEWLYELGSSQHNLAVLHQDRGEFEAARSDFLAELATCEKNLANNPEDSTLRSDLADVNSWLGRLAAAQPDFVTAMKYYLAQAALLEQLVRAKPRTVRWRYDLGNVRLLQAGVQLVTGQYAEAEVQLQEARQLFDGLVAFDPSNRLWLAASLRRRIYDVRLAWRRGDLTAVDLLLEETRPQLGKLTTVEAEDRTFAATICRMEAQLRLATGKPDAAAAAARAVKLGEALVREGHLTDGELGEYAYAGIVAGEIAAQAGDATTAHFHWRRTAELLAPRLTEAHNWQLFDPAARAALHLGHVDEARALISQLTLFGYVPLEPWPNADQSDAAEIPAHPKLE